ncbi:uncharacterized protein [Spinacia oleracea]|uniref:Uncharacterized protein isoform X2 n=1 Tax=Spinacia oleracea TaxID=3562 RepID=A0A9R0I6L3_SPIOL|nr:uncharacterized protein LOC110783415 isoform X2 [Spinacia oleracea]
MFLKASTTATNTHIGDHPSLHTNDDIPFNPEQDVIGDNLTLHTSDDIPGPPPRRKRGRPPLAEGQSKSKRKPGKPWVPGGSGRPPNSVRGGGTPRVKHTSPRTYPGLVVELVNELCPIRREWVEKAGFGSILNLKIQKVDRLFLAWLEKRWDCKRQVLRIRDDYEITIDENMISWITGVPLGMYKFHNLKKNDKEVQKYYDEYVIGSAIGYVTVYNKCLLEEDPTVFLRHFILLTFGCLFCMNTYNSITPKLLPILKRTYIFEPYPIGTPLAPPPWALPKVQLGQPRVDKPILPSDDAKKSDLRCRAFKLRRPKKTTGQTPGSKEVPESTHTTETASEHVTQSSKEDVGKNQKRRAKGDGVDRVDETSSDDETDSDKETLNYKTKVDPTEKNISEIILRRKIFGDQVLFTSDSVSLSRDMLYNSFKKKGEISMEVMAAWCRCLNKHILEISGLKTYVVLPEMMAELLGVGVDKKQFNVIMNKRKRQFIDDMKKGFDFVEVEKLFIPVYYKGCWIVMKTRKGKKNSMLVYDPRTKPSTVNGISHIITTLNVVLHEISELIGLEIPSWNIRQYEIHMYDGEAKQKHKEDGGLLYLSDE